MTFISVSDAARQLGLSTRQVRRLVAAGDLHRVATGVLDRQSVDQHARRRQSSHRRAWDEPTAWAAVALLSGQPAPWIGPSQLSRLRRRLIDLDADGLVERTRNLASISRYRGHDAARRSLLATHVNTDTATRRLGLTPTDSTDVYVSADDLDITVDRHLLQPDVTGNILLRKTTMPQDIVAELAHHRVLAALNLADSHDSRARAVADRVLTDALTQKSR